METKLAFVDRLLAFERRVCRVYQKWAADESFSAELRALWKELAEEEKQHLAALERSASLLNFAAAPPTATTAQMEAIDAMIATAERLSGKAELTADEALGHALALESTELHQLDDAWLRGFRPDLASLTHGPETPAQDAHIRRLSDGVRRFTGNEELHERAASLLSGYERQKAARTA